MGKKKKAGGGGEEPNEKIEKEAKINRGISLKME